MTQDMLYCIVLYLAVGVGTGAGEYILANVEDKKIDTEEQHNNIRFCDKDTVLSHNIMYTIFSFKDYGRKTNFSAPIAFGDGLDILTELRDRIRMGCWGYSGISMLFLYYKDCGIKSLFFTLHFFCSHFCQSQCSLSYSPSCADL